MQVNNFVDRKIAERKSILFRILHEKTPVEGTTFKIRQYLDCYKRFLNIPEQCSFGWPRRRTFAKKLSNTNTRKCIFSYRYRHFFNMPFKKSELSDFCSQTFLSLALLLQYPYVSGPIYDSCLVHHGLPSYIRSSDCSHSNLLAIITNIYR